MKDDGYRRIIKELRSLLGDEPDIVARAANLSALLFERLPDINWVGVYFLKGNELVLGPFQGKPACLRISLGKGVCGVAAAHRETMVVPNVHEFEGHIACDAVSNSEVVVPIVVGQQLLGVLDVDSPLLGRFDTTDKQGLEAVAAILAETPPE